MRSLVLSIALLAVTGVTALRSATVGSGNIVDWRQKGAVTPPKAQITCNASYAFAAASTIESAWQIAGHELRNLSVQQLISCATAANGCSGGGTGLDAFNYLLDSSKGQLDTADSYPFISGTTSAVPMCNTQGKVVGATISGKQTLSQNEQDIANYVSTNGPVLAMIDLHAFANYQPSSSPVITSCPLVTPSYTHAVSIVGFNQEESPSYWIVKNSFGTEWGIDGYAYIQMGSDVCGITSSVTSVQVGGATLPPTNAPPQTNTPAPPIPPPTPVPPLPPSPPSPPSPHHWTEGPDHHWTESPDHHWTESPDHHHSGGDKKISVKICSDYYCSECKEAEFYENECAWEESWSFKATCESSEGKKMTSSSSWGSKKVKIDFYTQNKCEGYYTSKTESSGSCFSRPSSSGKPLSSWGDYKYVKFECPYDDKSRK